MAKLGLVLIAVFCVIQISLAARIPREAPTESTTALLDSWKEQFDKGLEGLASQAKATFTKENADELWNNIQTNFQNAGDKLGKIGKDISQTVQTKIAELNKDDEKKN